MNKLNVFAGPRYPEGDENRLTWALMTLLRLVPMACVAFVDLVRARQEHHAGVPIPALTTMSGCRTHIETQVSHLQARAGRLVAVGITREGGDVKVAVEAKARQAIYDGVITFEPPDRDVGAIDSHEPVTLTVESKRGSSVGAWQLRPSISHLPPPEDDGEPPLHVDRQAIVLAWRDIFRALTDLDSRNLLHPSEAFLVNDFLQHVRYRHPELNPFDRFALCRGDIGLLNRRCEEIMREVEPKEAWAGSSPIIKVESPAFRRIYLWAERNRNGAIGLGLWPGDTMAQAREFWRLVNAAKLKALGKSKSWEVQPNLHFSRIQRHFHWAESQLTVEEYIDYWKDSHEQEIQSCYRSPSGSFRHQWEALSRRGLISSDDVEKLDQQTTPTNYRRISMSPGLAVQYMWSRSEAEVLDARGAFAEEVRRRIREATETWGEIPRFCEQAGARSNAPADA